MQSARALTAGTLLILAVAMSAAAQSRGTVVEMRDTPGPIEQQAISASTQNPVPRHAASKPAPYPWQLRRIGGQAAMVLQVTVDARGRVAEIRKLDGPLVQPAIGSPTDEATAQAATEGVVQAAVTALNQWRFDEPANDGPLTFAVTFGFIGGEVRYAINHVAAMLPEGLGAAPWAAAEGAIPTGAIAPPKRTKYVRPVYPQIAAAQKIAGDVMLEVVIGPDGRVRDARVIKSIPLLDQSAIDATMQTRYEPAVVNGIPVPVIAIVTHTYSIK